MKIWKCPTCDRGSLKVVHRGRERTAVGECLRCGGAWFPRGRLQKILSRPVSDLKPESKTPLEGRRCPQCDVSLLPFTYPHTTTEGALCPKCKGTWLAKGRLEELRIAMAALHGAPGRPSEKSPTGPFGKLLARFRRS